MAIKAKHTIIVIPGLNDHGFFSSLGIRLALLRLRHDPRFDLCIFRLGWQDGENFAPKLDRLSHYIQEKRKQGRVSLIGTSAGGSAALNAFVENCFLIDKAVNVCGRLRRGIHKRLTLKHAAGSSIAFEQSVLLFETKNEPQLTNKQRQRILTIKPRFGDEVVPGDTVQLNGANNQLINSSEHIISIYLALAFPQVIVRFLLNES